MVEIYCVLYEKVEHVAGATCRFSVSDTGSIVFTVNGGCDYAHLPVNSGAAIWRWGYRQLLAAKALLGAPGAPRDLFCERYRDGYEAVRKTAFLKAGFKQEGAYYVTF